MTVRAALPWALPLALTLLLCAALTVPSAVLATSLPLLVTRGIGFALLGCAGFALFMVFRALPSPPAEAAPTLRVIRRDSEYRRGFASGRSGPKRPRIEPQLVVVPLVSRRPREADAATPPRSLAPATENIGSVQQRLQDRAEALWRRRA